MTMVYWQAIVKGQWREVASPYFFTEEEAMSWAASLTRGDHQYETVTITRYIRP